MATLTFVQGDTINEVITVKSNGSIIDISGGTLKFRIVRQNQDVKENALYSNDNVLITDGVNGQGTLTIARSITKLWPPDTYLWELEYIDNSSNYSHTYTDVLIIKNSIYSADA